MEALAAAASAVYALAMALVLGGVAALSFAVAPQAFRTLPPADAGRVVGRALRTFDGMAWVAAMAGVASGVVRMAVRVTAPGVAMVVVAAAIQVLVTLLRRSVAPRMAGLGPPEGGDPARAWDPEDRRRFQALHAQYARLYAANLFLALAGLVLLAVEG